VDSHAAVTPPYAIEELSLERVDRALRQALENDLAAILCLSCDGLASSFSAEEQQRFHAYWEELSRR
jgi:dihydrodipicolinate synthase/N-acetylneuraminate lyase